jgi:hypothetical protein
MSDRPIDQMTDDEVRERVEAIRGAREHLVKARDLLATYEAADEILDDLIEDAAEAITIGEERLRGAG